MRSRWKRTAVVVLLAGGLACLGCAAAQVAPAAPTAGGGCQTGIDYQGRTLDVGATWKLLGINVGTEMKAVREVSDLVQLYLNEAASLCDLHATGKLTAVEYADRRATLAERLARLVAVNRQIPATQVTQTELPFYKETLDALRPGATASTSFSVQVTSGGRLVQNGSAMKGGEPFRVTVDVPTRAYLYLVLIDSSGVVSRLYPSALTGNENPVQGRIDVPRSGEKEFVLDNRTGTERVLVFVNASRSNAIETMLAEVGAEGSKNTALAGILTRGVKVRETVAQTSSSPGSVTASFGLAAYEFMIDHR